MGDSNTNESSRKTSKDMESFAQYQPLLDKMMAKITHWSSKFLSYGGRVQLIQSVLFAVQRYWSQIFVFPKKVMERIDSICRKFLWTGVVGDSRRAPVAWEDICRPCKEGGLNLIHLATLNQMSVCKLLWAVHSKADKLWIKWVHSFYIKGNDLKSMRCPTQASYLVRKMFKYRDKLVEQDIWNEVIEKRSFGQKVLYDHLRPPKTLIGWRELMCNNKATPKAKFILWMALQQRLATKDRVMKYNQECNPECVFCGNAAEDHDHLFFNCPWVASIWVLVQGWCKKAQINGTWSGNISLLCKETKGKAAQNRIFKVGITEFIYALWIERNRRIFKEKCSSKEEIVQTVAFKTVGRCIMDRKLEKACFSIKI